MCVSEGKSLKDEDVLQHLPVGTTATFYFRDLGAQISWVTVSVTQMYVCLKHNPLDLASPCRMRVTDLVKTITDGRTNKMR